MKITVQGNYKGSVLFDEIIAAAPALVALDPEGTRRCALNLDSGPDSISVTWDESTGVTEQQIAAVLAAHNPVTLTPREQLMMALAAYQLPSKADALAFLSATPPTNAQVISMVKALVVLLLRDRYT